MIMITSMKLTKPVVTVIVIALFGCQVRQDKTIPEELMGKWETSAPRYEDCSFELKDELIIFNKGINFVNLNHIKRIERFPDKQRVSYNIIYEDKQGQEYKLALFYFKTPNGGVIRFKNQKEIEWTKKKDELSLK